MFFLPPPTYQQNTYEKLEISSAFMTVLSTADETQNGQIGFINPNYLVNLFQFVISGTRQWFAGFMNSAGNQVYTRKYLAGGNVLELMAGSADNENNYFIAKNSNDVFIFSTSLDGSIVNWARKLNYGTLEAEICLAVTGDYVYACVENLSDTTIIQLDKFTGELNWDKDTDGLHGKTIAMRADDVGVYLCTANNSNFGPSVLAVSDTGVKRWHKYLGGIFKASESSLTGFAKSESDLFVCGIDNTFNNRLTVLKLNISSGALIAQKRITPFEPPPYSLDSVTIPSYSLDCGGGKLIMAMETGIPYKINVFVMDEDLDVETIVYALSNTPYAVRRLCVRVDNIGNIFVTGNRNTATNKDIFITSVLEDGTFPSPWTSTSRTVETPTYAISDASSTLAETTPVTNVTETIIPSTISNLATEGW